MLVSDVVLVEAVWTLGAVYAQGQADQLKAVRSLLDEVALAFENRAAVAAALAAAELTSCGFSDCLIVAKHAALSCTFTTTFDMRMRKLPGVRLV